MGYTIQMCELNCITLLIITFSRLFYTDIWLSSLVVATNLTESFLFCFLNHSANTPPLLSFTHSHKRARDNLMNNTFRADTNEIQRQTHPESIRARVGPIYSEYANCANQYTISFHFLCSENAPDTRNNSVRSTQTRERQNVCVSVRETDERERERERDERHTVGPSLTVSQRNL